ncbi:MAG: hydroxymethylpyrimidine/phosphomethylpyrimidine kinase [Acidobacteriaceae bacterium]
MKDDAAQETKENRSLLLKANNVKHLVRSALAPAALTVAGYDPSSGAGITADLQVLTSHGVRGVSAVTALTVQSATRVTRVEPVNARLLQETLDLLAEDEAITAVKVGMLARAELVEVVTRFLGKLELSRERIVLDPVLRSSSGAELLDPEGVQRLVAELLPVVGWVTPNLAEAGILAGVEEPGREAVPGVARRIQSLGAGHRALGTEHRAPGADAGLNVVVTGGHLDPPDDYLLTAAGEERWFPGVRVEDGSVHGSHGTGCAFSSALLCRVMLGDGPVEAVAGAKAFVTERLLGGNSAVSIHGTIPVR